ncbi:MAG: DMT family transporter [Ferruginibacter sp.]
MTKQHTAEPGSYGWMLFILLSVIWGSSFILMKEGLLHLNAWQVASLRIISAGLVLLPTAIKTFKSIPGNKIGFIFLSGMLGSLLPAYLFCIAEQEIDSALAGVLNSLTPIFVILFGVLFFGQKIPLNKILGIAVALGGSVLLFLSQDKVSFTNFLYGFFILVATMLYGINVNMVHKYLQGIPSLRVVSLAMVMNSVPALLVLVITGYFRLPLADKGVLWSTAAAFILGVAGTAIASILFYALIKRAGVVFSSMVTYGIPVVAIAWGIIYGEKVGWVQVLCLGIILSGVYIANRAKKSVKD